jgi:hypothetical protein
MKLHVCPICKDKWVITSTLRAEVYIDHLEQHLDEEADA